MAKIDVGEAVTILKGVQDDSESYCNYCDYLAVVIGEGKKSPKQVAMAVHQSFEMIKAEDPSNGNPIFGRQPEFYTILKEEVPGIMRRIFPEEFAEQVIQLL